MTDAGEPVRFISEKIEVIHLDAPLLSKRPGPPDRFVWRGQAFPIRKILGEWFDYGRKGDMARNMTKEHLRMAASRGSWGVGKFYFRVRTEGDRIFDLYYDRAPKDAADRDGTWILWRELAEAD